HKGHCYITCMGGSNNHHRLLHQEMSVWAKKMACYYHIHEAMKFAPPHCLNFDSGPTLKSG
ncbi:hypothetical protein BS17DRAFT_702201, partial [Gyrodon lividus]